METLEKQFHSILEALRGLNKITATEWTGLYLFQMAVQKEVERMKDILLFPEEFGGEDDASRMPPEAPKSPPKRPRGRPGSPVPGRRNRGKK